MQDTGYKNKLYEVRARTTAINAQRSSSHRPQASHFQANPHSHHNGMHDKSPKKMWFLKRYFYKTPLFIRVIIGVTILLLLAELVLPIYDAQKTASKYDLTKVEGIILSRPIDLYADKLAFQQSTGSYLYNQDYKPGASEVAGQNYTPKFSAEFKQEEDGVSVYDPENEVSLTFKPKFDVSNPRKDKNRIVYPVNDINASKVYTLKASGVKEDIIVHEFQGNELEFKYDLEVSEGTEVRLENDGSLGVYGVSSALLGSVSTGTDQDAELLKKARENGAKQTLLFRVPKPVVLEANKKPSSAQASYTLDEKELTISASNLQSASYPLTIDPSVYVETAAKLMRGNNETNTDFDVDNELIQKSQTTGARIDSWEGNLDMDEGAWGNGVAAAGGYVYRTGGATGLTKPQIVSQQVSSSSSDSGTFTLNMPSTRPAGDLYIAMLCHDGTVTVTPPAGWTEYADTREHAAYYKVGTDQGGGNEAASYNWTNSGSETFYGVIIRVTGFNSSDPVSGTAGTGSSGSDATPVFPATTPDSSATLVVRAVGADADTPSVSDTWIPDGHTKIAAGNSGGTSCGFASASLDTPPLTGVSSGTATFADTSINDTYGASSIAINPSGATPPPQIQSSTESLQNTNSTNFTMNMPSTRPAGDLYIAVMCHDGSSGSNVSAPGGGGWTEYADLQGHAAYYKIGTDAGGGNEAASYTWTGPNENWAGVIIRVTGFDSADPLAGTATTISSGSSTTPQFPAITPDDNKSLIIRAVGADNDEPSATAWVPSGHSKIASGGSTLNNEDCAYLSASLDNSPASGVAAPQVGMADTQISDDYGASSIAIKANPTTATSNTRSTLSWARFNSSSLAIESPNPGEGTCSGWCTDSTYNMPAGRRGHNMVAYNGYLYVMGGLDTSGNRTSTVYIAKLGANGEPQLWHPTDTNKDNWVYWYTDSGLNGGTAKSYFGAVAYNNRMYIVGGDTNASPNGITTVEYANINPNGTLGSWSTTGMDVLPGGAGTHMLNVLAYNDTLYAIGGFEGAITSSANMRATVYYTKLNSDGTMNDWQQTSSFTTARASFGGMFTAIWGAYIYLAGACTGVNGSGYCTSYASDTQLASINADGTIDDWADIDGLVNTRIGYNLLAWQGGLYRFGGCTEQSASTGVCGSTLADVDYGVVNPAGEVSTVSISSASGAGNCTGGTPYDCDLPPPGDDAGEAGNMLSMSTIHNGYLYVIGGCIDYDCDGTSPAGDDSDVTGNTAYVSIGANGQLAKPDVCSGTLYGAWCVDSTNKINNTGSNTTDGVAAGGITTFNNRIYVIGGTNGNGLVTNIYYNSTNKDGSFTGAWSTVDMTTAGIAEDISYTYAYARSNPSSAGSNPGNLYVFGGCGTMGTGAGCSSDYESEVYKCNIATSGSVSGCTTTGQLQIDSELGDETDQGLGLHSGTVYANYIYLIGGYSSGVPDRDTVFYAKFDNSNNVVSVTTSAAGGNNDDWIESPNDLSVGRRRGFSFGYNGHIYSTGGYDDSGTGIIPFIEWSKLDVSDGSNDAFVTSTVTINQRWGLTMTISNGYAYVIGGCDVGTSPSGCSSFETSVQTFQLFNNNSGTGDTYTAFTDDTLNFGNNRRGGSSAILNGYLYLAGGCTSSTEPCTTAVSTVGWTPLDPDNGAPGTWQGTSGTCGTSTSNLPAVRVWGKLVTAGGQLYYLGGQTSTATAEQSTVYYTDSISSGTPVWNCTAASGGIGDTASQAAQERTKLGAAVWNDRIYVVGGLNSSATVTNTVYVSPQLSSGGNIAADSWTSTTAFNVARSQMAVTAYANNLYLFGGYDGTNYLSDSQFTQINSDGTVDSWSYTTSLPGPLADADAFSENGYVYVVGGRSAASSCEPQVISSPISANTTIASGNNPTGIGEWYESNESYGSGRYGAAAAVYHGKLYLGTGGCAAPLGPDYSTGTITQSGYIITGAGGASWTDDWIGARMEYADASTATIIAVNSATQIVVDVSKTIGSAQSYNISPERFWYTTLRSQPQVAIYSRMIDTDTDVFPNSWLLNGLDNSIGARWQVRYRSMNDIDGVATDCGSADMSTWGQDTDFGNTTLGDVNTYTPKDGSGNNINCARYFYFYISIDASKTFGYPEDVARGPTITDISLFFTSDPSKRLRHGKTFTGGEQQPLDTPCRQSVDANCPLP